MHGFQAHTTNSVINCLDGLHNHTSTTETAIPPQYTHIARRSFPDYRLPDCVVNTYEKVVSRGLPNAKGARHLLKSSLNVSRWKAEATNHPNHKYVLDGVEFGFSLQYDGPPEPGKDYRPPNHTSAREYPTQVKQYLIKEVQEGALVGPLNFAPFTTCCTFSPMMTKPKSDGKKRQIIVDLSFPDGGVNKFIPTTHYAINLIHDLASSDMAAVDVSRAYRNFRICPADWPLLIIHHDELAYMEMAMPFGARSSSYSMQQAAMFITRVLEKRGVRSLMYLDDLFISAPSKQAAIDQYQSALELLTGLGLPRPRILCGWASK